MVIKILGGGCANCKALYQSCEEACKELGIEAELVKVEDFSLITQYNVMSTPALVIDDVITIKGRIPTKDEVLTLLK